MERTKTNFAAKILSAALALAIVLSCFVTSAIPGTSTEVSAATTTADASTFSWDNATVYFLLTDRFYNGDTSNDHSYNRGLDKNGNIAAGDKSASFQGGDFAGITQKINEGYFNDLGVNAIWLSAPYEQIHGYVLGGDGDPTFPHYSYHGYYVLDYTESDKNFGSKEEFKTLVDTAHEHGIRIVIDIVMNHAGYQSIYDMDEYGFGALNSGWEDYYYAHQVGVGRADYHSKYMNYDSSTASQWATWWGPDWIRCGLPGYTQGSGDIEGCLSGLPDFKTGSSQQVTIPDFLKTKWTREGTYNEKIAKYGSSNTVTGYISDWLAEWVREYGIDGFRCDTAKHVEKSAWRILKDKCVAALKEWKANNPDKKLDDLEFWTTGEAFGLDLNNVDMGYYSEGKFDSMINFEFAPGAGSSNIPQPGDVDGRYNAYASKINNNDNFNLLTYISSHDTTLARGDRKYAGSFLLMMPGGVQIYYGDETNRPVVSVPSDSTDGAGHKFRGFMNWDSMDKDVLAHWQKVGQFRNNHIAVGAGQHKTITSYDSTNGYTFARTYNKNGIEDTIVATLFAQANRDITIDVSSVWTDGMQITNFYDGTTCEVKNGKVTFNSGANGTILLEEPAGAKGKVTVKHVDQDTNKVLKTQTMVGLIGDSYTISPDSELTKTYDYVRASGSTSGTYSENEVTVTLYYHLDTSKFGTITISHVDAATGETLAETTTETGKIGETYTAQPATIKDYEVDLAASSNTSGTYKSGNIDVVFKYNYVEPTNLRVHYYNANNWSSVYMYTYTEEGSVATEYNGKWPGTAMTAEGDGWFVGDVQQETESALVIFNNGSGTQEPSGGTAAKGYDASGEVWIKNGTVNKGGKVKVIYQDTNGKVLATETLSGIADGSNTYTTAAKTFDGYTLKTTPSNATGKFTESTIIVTYIYQSDNPVSKLINNSTISSTSITYNNTITFNGKASGGTAPYKYRFAAKHSSSSSYTILKDYDNSATTKVWRPTKTGTYSILIRAKDSDGTVASKTLTLTVKAATSELTNKSTISATSVTYGNTITFTGKASGGKSPYKYRFAAKHSTDSNYKILKDYDNSATTKVWRPTKTGTYTVLIRAKDNSGTVASKTYTLTVKAASITNNSTISATSITYGDTITFTGKASGGTSPYTYRFAAKHSSDSKYTILKDYDNSATTKVWRPTKTGTYTVLIRAKDKAGTVDSNTYTLKVTAQLKNNSSISATSITYGNTITFTGKASGGSGSYQYRFAAKHSTDSNYTILKDYSNSATTKVWRPTKTGTYTVLIRAKDKAGTISSKTYTLTVKKAATLTNSSTISATSISYGKTITFTGKASGGTSPYQYRFAAKHSTASNYTILKDYDNSATTKVWRPTKKGTYTVLIRAKDKNGTVASKTYTLTVK